MQYQYVLTTDTNEVVEQPQLNPTMEKMMKTEWANKKALYPYMDKTMQPTKTYQYGHTGCAGLSGILGVLTWVTVIALLASLTRHFWLKAGK